MLIESILSACRSKNLKVTTVESCTGGMIAAALTSVSGSSAVVDRAFVTYSNQSKHEMVGVANELLDAHGAVSAQVGLAMAEGALKHAPVDIAVSVTGLASPGGESETKPVGLVFIGMARDGFSDVKEFHFKGDRNAVRQQAMDEALKILHETVKQVL